MTDSPVYIDIHIADIFGNKYRFKKRDIGPALIVIVLILRSIYGRDLFVNKNNGCVHCKACVEFQYRCRMFRVESQSLHDSVTSRRCGDACVHACRDSGNVKGTYFWAVRWSRMSHHSRQYLPFRQSAGMLTVALRALRAGLPLHHATTRHPSRVLTGVVWP